MSFDRPWLLVLGLALAAVFAYAFVLFERRSTARDLVYSNVPFFIDAVKPRAWIPALLRGVWFAALFLGALALGGPHLRLPLPVHNGAVFICIDTSGSMQSTDVFPTRASAAKAAAAAFVDETPSGTRIGIIAFSGQAVLVSPLSSDHDAVKAALDGIPPPNGATAIGDALQLAAQELPATGHRVVVLITDGVNNTGVDPTQMAEYLGSRRIPIYTIGIGTPNGDVISGEQSTIDEGALQEYAAASGGAYARAENASQLRSALRTAAANCSSPTSRAVPSSSCVRGSNSRTRIRRSTKVTRCASPR
jgi:Ca-activated chloride channel family protein